MKVVKFVLLH